MFGDWKRDCTSRTLVDSAFAGSQALASFFSAPVSFDDSGSAITSTTSQKPTTTHLVQLPAGISVSLLATLFIDSPSSAGGQHGLSGCRPQDQPSDGPARNELSGGLVSTRHCLADQGAAQSVLYRTSRGLNPSSIGNRHLTRRVAWSAKAPTRFGREADTGQISAAL